MQLCQCQVGVGYQTFIQSEVLVSSI